MMMANEYMCPICKMEGAKFEPGESYDKYFCHYCGRFLLEKGYSIEKFSNDEEGLIIEHLILYMYHHANEYTVPIICAKESTLKKIETHKKVYRISPAMIEEWFPKTISMKVNLVLLKVADLSKFEGDTIIIGDLTARGRLYFARESEYIRSYYHNAIKKQIAYMESYLKEQGYIKILQGEGIQLRQKAWERIEELQRKQIYNHRAFVAIDFGESTNVLREKIREGVQSAGYQAIFMDEEHYNGQIVPEMLYRIDACRFVIADLTHKNSNVYFEAGYATGQNKEVIYLCKEAKLDTSPQFDVAQYNLLTYETIDEIPQKLKARIEATIGRR